MIIINGIRSPLEANENEIVDQALKLIKVTRGRVAGAYIIKRSVDARHREISLVYSVGVELDGGEAETVNAAASPQVRLRQERPYDPRTGSGSLHHRPVIAGFGPAGMFAGLLLAKMGYRPLILERGGDVDNRVREVEAFFAGGPLNPSTNVQFGEGGAGTFSDGKLTTRINDPRCDTILRTLYENGAPVEILRDAKPHIGTDLLRNVVKSVREKIISFGGEVKFNVKLDGIQTSGGKLTGVSAEGTGIPADVLILAIGHSARDVFEWLLECGVELVPKPFSVGARIEHPQSLIDRALYGRFAGSPVLPHGEYQLSLRRGGRAVYTFCMCPGGRVVAAASEPRGVVTNGMSFHSRGGENANAALVVSVGPEDFEHEPLGGVKFQRSLECAAFEAGGGNYHAPCQTVAAFLGEKNSLQAGTCTVPTYLPGTTEYPLEKLFPPYVVSMMKTGLNAFNARISGYADGGAVLTGVETRTSSPVRITRTDTFEATGFQGLYPAGEGAGYAGGIVSAAVDGLKVAEAVMARYAPFD